MTISRLYIYQFRNLETQTLLPHPKLDVFLGQNGQGKTNLLEAIALGLSLKPLRSIKQIKELIQQGQEESAIHLNMDFPHKHHEAISIQTKGKKATLNEKPLKDTSSLFEKTALVTFVPDDLQIILGSGSYRRRFLDQLTAGLFPQSVRVYRSYERALLARNHVLKSYPFDASQFQAFSRLLCEMGAAILWYRKEALLVWKPFFEKAAQSICGLTKPINLQYQSTLYPHCEQSEAIQDFNTGLPSSFQSLAMTTQAFQDLLMQSFAQVHKEERIRKTTLLGPHLDDLIFFFENNLSVRQTASRGQARALTLAMKIAQLQTIEQVRQQPPILLLDDVAGELDPTRANCLFELIHNLQIQTFLTTTHLETLPFQLTEASLWDVEDGKLK